MSKDGRINLQAVLLVLLLGAVWGLNEVLAGGWFEAHPSPWSRPYLAAFALLVLALGRGLLNRPGASTAVGLLAVLFKTVNTAPFPCHLLGIFFTALAFDGAASLLLRRENRLLLRGAAAGMAAAWAGHLLFAAAVTWGVRLEPWASGGMTRLTGYVLGAGSLAAILAAFVVPSAFVLGLRGKKRLLAMDPQRLTRATAAAAVILWVVGTLALRMI